MNYLVSKEDREFRRQVESCEFPVPEFDHKAHLRLAYTYLVEVSTAESVRLIRNTIIGLLKHGGVAPLQNYHETLTEAWVMAVHYFIKKTESAESAGDFIEKNEGLLDSNIMLTLHSAEVLLSERAYQSFVKPELDPIPGHGT